MADPVPFIQGLCTSQSSMDLYVQLLNQKLAITLNLVNETLGENFELPGIPPITLQKSPDILLPGWADWERQLKIRSTPVPKGYMGNVFPLRHTGKKVDGRLKLPGVPDVIFGAPEVPLIQGVNPSTLLIKFLNQNLEILFELLNEEGLAVVPVLVPMVELCGETPLGDIGGAVPGTPVPPPTPGQILLNQILDLNLQSVEAAIVGGGCVNTLSDAFEPYTHADYFISESSNDVAVVPGADFVDIFWEVDVGTTLETGFVRGWPDAPDPAYRGTSPTQLFACGHGFQLDFSGRASIPTSGTSAELRVSLRKIDTANTVTSLGQAVVLQSGVGTTGFVSRTITIPAGQVNDTDVVTIHVQGQFQGPGLDSGSVNYTSPVLTDLGP